ncbi:MAG: hypothetical protein WCL16_01635 [bacterium]
MQNLHELRKRQLIITSDFKARAQKAENLLGEIEECEKRLATLSETLSTVLLLDVIQAAAATIFPKAKTAKTPKVKAAKAKVIKAAMPAKPNPVAVKTSKAKPESSTLKDSVRDFMLKAGTPMKIAAIVKSLQKAGYVFQSKKPVKAMTKLMYNNPKVFKRVKPGTFKAV